jgi:hypothetical protein
MCSRIFSIESLGSGAGYNDKCVFCNKSGGGVSIGLLT